MSVGQKQIAERLDLSITTVSRSLRGHADIHPETRKRVRKLASKLGYRLRGHSRYGMGTASRKHVMLGTVVCRDKDLSHSPETAAYHMLAGVSEGADKMDVTLTTHFISPDVCSNLSDPENQFPAMRAGMLSGMVLIYDFPNEAVRGFASLLPCVTLVHSHVDMGVDCIDSDQAAGIATLVQRLHDLGHRRIGFMAGQKRYSWIFPRFMGYMRKMDRLGLTIDPSLTINIYKPDFDPAKRADVVIEQCRNGVTAWVCDNDDTGYNLYSRLTARGLRIPRDISLTGFTGLVPSSQEFPQLTTVQPPLEQMGAAAVKQLLSRIKHPDGSACHLQFGCEFIEGKTTGPPARP